MKKKTWVIAALVALVALVAAAGIGLKVRANRGASGGEQAAELDPSKPRVASKLELAEVLYDGKLSAGWDDWGWGPHQLGNGPAQVVFEGYGGIILHHTELESVYGGITYRFKAPEAWGEFMHVSLRGTGLPDTAFPTVPILPRHVAKIDGGWREVLVSWAELNPEGRAFDRVMIGSRTTVAGDWVLLDQVALTKGAPKAAAPKKDESLRVLCDGKTHAISEFIYGNSTDDWESGQSAKRMGGNPHSRLNWEIGAWNTGNDWFYENQAGKVTMFEAIDSTAKDKRTLAFVVPLLGWVAKDKTSFAFPRSRFAGQRKYDPYKTEAGDGFMPNGDPIKPGPPELTSMPAPPELLDKWIRKVLEQDRARGWRSVHQYILDNEPTLWNTSHRDLHPDPLTYDELLERTLKYAAVIREADPEAQIAGPAEWGWLGYNYSARDRESGVALKPDRLLHGNTPLVPWYLKELQEHEKETGKRLLDVLDLHFYPAQDGVFGGNAKTDPETSEMRIRSTRALWDPTYKDESWIAETIKLIPRMKEWVAQNYPGLKLSIGEWDFGAEGHISGGLAAAETLGRFGQQGLDYAFHWGELKEGTPTYWAFRAFRNFDGKGARFQDVSLPVKEASKTSLFASRDAARTKLVLVLINRDAASKVSGTVAFQGCGRVGSARAFSYGRDSKDLKESKPQVSDLGLVAELDPYSFTVIEMSIDGAAP